MQPEDPRPRLQACLGSQPTDERPETLHKESSCPSVPDCRRTRAETLLETQPSERRGGEEESTTSRHVNDEPLSTRSSAGRVSGTVVPHAVGYAPREPTTGALSKRQQLEKEIFVSREGPCGRPSLETKMSLCKSPRRYGPFHPSSAGVLWRKPSVGPPPPHSP